MAPAAQPGSDSCHDCGREVIDARQVLARLWKSPADGREHWGAVPVCPDCARQRDQWRQVWLSVVLVLVALLTAAVAYALLP
jgi:hypothetical protein